MSGSPSLAIGVANLSTNGTGEAALLDCAETLDPDRVEGALTATESLVDAVVLTDAVEPVRSKPAASLGRGREGIPPGPDDALMFIRAAS